MDFDYRVVTDLWLEKHKLYLQQMLREWPVYSIPFPVSLNLYS